MIQLTQVEKLAYDNSFLFKESELNGVTAIANYSTVAHDALLPVIEKVINDRLNERIK